MTSEGLEVITMGFLIEEQGGKSSTGSSNFKQETKIHVVFVICLGRGLDCLWTPNVYKPGAMYLKVFGKTGLLFIKLSEARWSLENTVRQYFFLFLSSFLSKAWSLC